MERPLPQNVNLFAWNICDGFSDDEHAAGIVRVIENEQPDVAVFSEAYKEGDEAHVQEIIEKFQKLGYTALNELYEDSDGRRDRHGLLAISKIGELAVQRMKTRNFAHITVADTRTSSSINIYGVHLDDRKERGRIWQTRALQNHIASAPKNDAHIIMGDFNAMHASDTRARFFRTIRSMWKLLPSVEPGTPMPTSFMGRLGRKIARAGSMGRRVSSMAYGSIMRRFEEIGFRDADIAHTPTCHGAQLDHILVTDNLDVAGFMTLSNHHGLSDHKPISARVRKKQHNTNY